MPITVSVVKDENKKQVTSGGMKVSGIDEDERSVIAIISTDAIDRDGEILLPKGMDAENFANNPVVPWSHWSMDPPIGKALWIKKGVKRITAKVQFATTDLAEEVWQLFKDGFLKAFSVGFIALESHKPTPAEIKKKPEWAEARRVFDKWELLEFSPVTVPANPEALRLAMKNKTITISDRLQHDLHLTEKDHDFEIIEEENIVEDIENLDKLIEEIEKEIEPEIELDPIEPQVIEHEKEIDLQPVVELLPDIKDVALEEIKRKKGKMFY